MTPWAAIVAVAILNVLFKALGPTVLGNRELPMAVQACVGLLGPALITALIVVTIAADGWSAVDRPLVAGLATIAVARLARASILVAILAGLAVTALLRLI